MNCLTKKDDLHEELREMIPKSMKLIKGIPKYFRVLMKASTFTIVFKYWNEGSITIYMSREDKLPDSKHCIYKEKNPNRIVMKYSEAEEQNYMFITFLSPTGLTLDTCAYFGEIDKKDLLIDLDSTDSEESLNFDELPKGDPTAKE